ncbi:MAG: hypothetical protein GX660_04805 [Clostridiaceae bacterium]|nr:hypothetical protein [Clostridiaceae bacterium]
MKYLENSFRFFGKFFLLAIPMYIMFAVPQILMSPALLKIQESAMEIGNNPESFANLQMQEMLEMFASIYMEALPMMGLSIAASFILGLIIIPATYGVINKALSTGKADLTDFLSEFLHNIGKYILYYIGLILVSILLTIVIAVLIGLFVLMSKAIGALGVVLSVLIGIAVFLALLAFGFMLVYWFPAMVADNKGVFQGLKSSISVAKSYFWPTVGISLLISVGSAIAGAVVGGVQFIPVLGPLVVSIPAAVAQFITTVFYIIVYRDKTGKVEEEDNSVTELPGGYL